MKQAFRLVLRNPGFSLVAVLTLALGIGATTTIFGVVNAVVLRPLPYKDPDRLVLVWNNFLKLGMERLPAKGSEYIDYANQSRVFDGIAGFNNASFILMSGDEPERIVGARVTSSLFVLLDAQPFVGRIFGAEDNQPGGNRPAVLSYGFWQRRFGSNPAAVGSPILLDGQSYTVIGIMPPSFLFPHPSFPFAEPADLWIPFVFDSPQMTRRGDPYGLRVIARLNSGATIDQARADMDGIGQQYPGYQGPGSDLGWKITVVPLMDEITGGLRRALFVLLGAVGFVLLIACVNVANLLLARTSSRQRELAVRTALGANRVHLVWQSLSESLMIGILGGTGGLLLSFWGIETAAIVAPGNIPRIREASFDPQVFGFVFGISLLSSMVFGVLPAFRASAIPASDWLRHGAGLAGGLARSRIRSVLVVSEIALALVPLTGAGLLIQSFLRLRDVSPGFDAERVLAVELSVPVSKYAEPPEIARFYRDLRSAVMALPEVQSASLAETAPLRGGVEDPFSIEGRPLDPSAIPVASRKAIGPGYFESLRVPVRPGREFTERDGAASEPVAVINETMAKTYWPNEDPIGQRIKLGSATGSLFPWVRIVGIAGDVPRGLDRAPRAEWYRPHEQQPVRGMILLIRTSGDPVAVLPRVREQLRALDRGQPVTRVGTLDETIQQAIAQPRFRSLALTLFAVMALALAAVGIFGVVSYSVSQRTQEIGVRIALGASRIGVLRLVMRQAVTLLFAGVAAGIAGSLVLNQLLSSLLFAVTPADPVTYVVVTLLLVLVGLTAAWIPAYRAARVDPLVALRHE